MRKLTLLTCSLAICLTGCAPKGDPQLRSREDRRHADPTLGTDNRESEVYKTQTIAAPPVQPAVTTPAKILPAKLPAQPVPTRATPANAKVGNPSGF